MWPQRRDSEAGVKQYAAELEQSRQADLERNRAAIKDAIMQSWPVELAKSAYGAATLPGDVYAGRVDPMSDEAVQRSADFAGLMTLGAGGVPAGANELRAGIKLRSGALTPETDLAWYLKDVKRKPNFTPSENRRLAGGATTFDDAVVPVRALNATQPRVNSDFASTTSSAGELPYVIRKGGEMYVSDGHHRIAKTLHEGSENVRVRLIDLDARDTSAPLLDWKPNSQAGWGASDDELIKLLMGK